MFLLVCWLVLGFIAGAIAESKGRSFWLWSFLGFFLGVFAILIVACLPRED